MVLDFEETSTLLGLAKATIIAIKANNLKTICANCQRIMQKRGVRWKQGNLLPDF